MVDWHGLLVHNTGVRIVVAGIEQVRTGRPGSGVGFVDLDTRARARRGSDLCLRCGLEFKTVYIVTEGLPCTHIKPSTLRFR